MSENEKRRIHYGSPVLPLDYPNDGEPIWPCPECLPWHVEVIDSELEGGVVIREWHAVDCSRLTDDADESSAPE